MVEQVMLLVVPGAAGCALGCMLMVAGDVRGSVRLSYRKVGGLRFVRVGSLVVSFCVSRKGAV